MDRNRLVSKKVVASKGWRAQADNANGSSHKKESAAGYTGTCESLEKVAAAKDQQELGDNTICSSHKQEYAEV